MNKDKHIPQGYKDSPLGIIPKEWEVKRLGDYVTIISGESPSLYNLMEKGEYPYVKVEDMNNCSKYQIESREYSNDAKNIISKGSVIFPKRGAAILNNKVRIAQTNILMDSNMMAITVKEDCLDPEFLYYTIIQEKLYKIADTSTIPQINNKHIVPYRFCLPLMDEQRNIVSLLNTWDTAIEKQSKLIEKLTLRKRALMQQLLTGKKRLTGYSGEWKKVRLGEIAKLETQTIVTSNINPKLYIGTENMLSNGKGIMPYEKDVTYFQVRKYQQGDILLSNIRPYLKKIWLSDQEGGCSTDIHVIRNKNCMNVDTSFLYYVLSLDAFFDYVMSSAKGSKMPRGDAKVLMTYPIEMPPYSEQIAIRTVLQMSDKEIRLANEKLANLQSQKRGLMQQLLTGKKRIMRL